MSQRSHHGQILPMDTELGEDGDTPGISQPISQVEVEELLYGEDRPAGERLDRLREFRDDLRERAKGDYFVEEDPRALLSEIELAIERLEVSLGEREGGELSDPVSLDVDPGAHRETLSPDDDSLEDIEAADRASLAEDDDQR